MTDMSLDSASSVDTSQKVIPSPLLLLEPRETDIDAMRQQAAQMGQHLALRLGGDGQWTQLFIYFLNALGWRLSCIYTNKYLLLILIHYFR